MQNISKSVRNFSPKRANEMTPVVTNLSVSGVRIAEQFHEKSLRKKICGKVWSKSSHSDFILLGYEMYTYLYVKMLLNHSVIRSVQDHTEHDLLDLAAYITENHNTIDQSDILQSLSEQEPTTTTTNTNDATSSGLPASESIVAHIENTDAGSSDVLAGTDAQQPESTITYVENWLAVCLKEENNANVAKEIVNSSPVKLLTGGIVDDVAGPSTDERNDAATPRKIVNRVVSSKRVFFFVCAQFAVSNVSSSL